MNEKIDDVDLEIMIKAAKDGSTVNELHEELGYSKSAIRIALAKAGITYHPGRISTLDQMDDETTESFIRDYQEWKPIQFLIEKYKLGSPATVYNIIRMLGLKPRTEEKGYLEGRKRMMDEAVDLYVKGFPIWDICMRCGTDNATLYNELHKRGVRIGRRRVSEEI